MANVTFVGRQKGEFLRANQHQMDGYVAFDVSSYAEYPMKLFSPFTFSCDFKIPVPGIDGEYSHSVEGIWQGLKIINGSVDRTLFTSKPKKRKGFVEGHQYGEDTLGIEDARWEIYVPSYKFYLDNYVPEELITGVLEEQRISKKIYLYDVGDNGDIRDPRPLAHAAILATYFNLRIFNQDLAPTNESEKELFAILDKDQPLEDKRELIKPLLSNDKTKKAFRYRCVEHPLNIDDFHIAQAMGYTK